MVKMFPYLNLFSEMKCLHDMNYNEVMLDYLLFLMMKDDVETAKELLQVYHTVTL